MARFTMTKEVRGNAGICIPMTQQYITYQEPTFEEFGCGNYLPRISPLYLYGPAIDKLAEYENIRDNPQEIREELHKGQVAWNENFNLRSEISDLKEKLDNATREKAYFKALYVIDHERKISLGKENEKLQKENEHLKTATLAYDIVTLLDERDALKRENDALLKAVENRDLTINKLEEENKKLNIDSNRKSSLLLSKNNRIIRLNNEIERLQARVDNLTDAMFAN